MLTLLNPTALLALAGLLVPVAIHLWNRRPGREVAVGSLRWLTAGANRRLRNLQLEQRRLLLLRAALLAVLAGAAAGPVWRQPLPASRGVVLLSAAVLRLPALAILRPTIDSLRRRGYALRWLAPDFPPVTGAQWRAGRASKPGGGRDSAESAEISDFTWARVQQAGAAFAGQPLLVVAPAALRQWQGPHPPLPAAVSWLVVPDTARTTWLQAAHWRGPANDTLQLLWGRSTEAGTTFRSQRVPYEARPGASLRVPGAGRLRLQSRPGGGQQVGAAAPDAPGQPSTVPIEGPMLIQLYTTPAYAAEARVLQAALRAAALGLPVPPQIKLAAAPPPASPASWLFWLSDQPLPPAWQAAVARGARVWQEASGPGVADTAQLAAGTGATTIFRREAGLPAGFSAGQPLWATSYGSPVLTRRRVGQGARYHLSTRLHPAWSQLADSPELPAQLLQLLRPESSDAPLLATPAPDRRLARYDQRALDPTQLAATTRTLATPGPAPAASQRTTALRPGLGLVAGLLFLLERLLARRRSSRALTVVTP